MINLRARATAHARVTDDVQSLACWADERRRAQFRSPL
jgi:hypothetical protein